MKNVKDMTLEEYKQHVKRIARKYKMKARKYNAGKSPEGEEKAMSKDMHPSNWQVEAEQAYELLAEKDEEIEFQSKQFKGKMDAIDHLHNQIDGRDAEIKRLHGNLNECTARGMKAEAELAKWTRKHSDGELQELKKQVDGGYASCQAYINGLECHLRQAEERGTEAERKVGIAKDAMETAIQRAQDHSYSSLGIVRSLIKVLPKLEGEKPYRHQGVSGEYTGASNKEPNKETLAAFKEAEEGKTKRFNSVDALMEDLTEPDWERLKECVTGLDKWIKDGGNPLMTGEDYLNIAKCTLWMKEQIAK